MASSTNETTKRNMRNKVAGIISKQIEINEGLLCMFIGKDIFVLEIEDPHKFINEAPVIIVHDIPYAPMPFTVGDINEEGATLFGHVEVDSDNKELQEKLREVRVQALAWGYQEGGSWWI